MVYCLHLDNIVRLSMGVLFLFKHKINAAEPEISFLFICLNCQNLVPELPTMQLDSPLVLWEIQMCCASSG